MLRRIYGSTNESGKWRNKYNHKLYQLYKNLAPTEFIRLYIAIILDGSCGQMGEQEIPKKIVMGEMKGKRPVRRFKRKWQEKIQENARELLEVNN